MDSNLFLLDTQTLSWYRRHSVWCIVRHHLLNPANKTTGQEIGSEIFVLLYNVFPLVLTDILATPIFSENSLYGLHGISMFLLNPIPFPQQFHVEEPWALTKASIKHPWAISGADTVFIIHYHNLDNR